MQTRSILVFAALALTIAAVYWGPPAQDDAVVLPAGRQAAVPSNPPAIGQPRTASASATGAVKGSGEVALLRPRTVAPEKDFNLFSSQSWAPPTPKLVPASKAQPPPEAEAPPPTAPPAPIKLLGRYEEGVAGTSTVAVFALFNDQNIVLRAGDTVGTDWHVDAIEGNQVVLTYLPLGQKQNLPWAAAP